MHHSVIFIFCPVVAREGVFGRWLGEYILWFAAPLSVYFFSLVCLPLVSLYQEMRLVARHVSCDAILEYKDISSPKKRYSSIVPHLRLSTVKKKTKITDARGV